MKILAIDPGTTQSAYVVWDGETCIKAAIVPNTDMRSILLAGTYDSCAIEMVACYGMAVGKEVFETCRWIGRFEEAITHTYQPGPTKFVYRREIKSHFCHSAKAKDSNIRQAIVDRFGGKDAAIGRKTTPGPLYGIKSHLWAALAIALYVQDTSAGNEIN